MDPHGMFWPSRVQVASVMRRDQQPQDPLAMQHVEGDNTAEASMYPEPDAHAQPHYQHQKRCMGVCYDGACQLQHAQGPGCCFAGKLHSSALDDDYGGLHDQQAVELDANAYDGGPDDEWLCWQHEAPTWGGRASGADEGADDH